MKKLRYADDIDGWGVVKTVTVEEAIKLQREGAYKAHQFVYTSDQEALDDFIAVNWAYWIDEAGNEVKMEWKPNCQYWLEERK